MNNIVNRLTETLGKALAESLTNTRSTDSLELSPQSLPIEGGEAVWLLPYRKHKSLLLSLKKGEEKSLRRVAKPLYDELVSIERASLVIPLPQSALRVIIKGNNHSLLLAKAVMRHNKDGGLRLEKGNLIKTKETKKQAKLSRRERLVEQRGVFRVRHPKRIQGKSIILLDDIVTTGATLSEAKKTLIQAGAKKVICVALAH